jgi:hypothetical protein
MAHCSLCPLNRALISFSEPKGLFPSYREGKATLHSREDLHIHHGEWTSSIAVGSRSLVETVKILLAIRAKGRDALGSKKGYQLREGPIENPL